MKVLLTGQIRPGKTLWMWKLPIIENSQIYAWLVIFFRSVDVMKTSIKTEKNFFSFIDVDDLIQEKIKKSIASARFFKIFFFFFDSESEKVFLYMELKKPCKMSSVYI